MQHLEAPLLLRSLLWLWGAPTGCKWGAGGTPKPHCSAPVLTYGPCGPWGPASPSSPGWPCNAEARDPLLGQEGTGRNWWGTEPWLCAAVPLYQPVLWAQPKDSRVKGTQSTPGHPTLGPRGPLGGRWPALPRLPWGQETADSEHSKCTAPTACVPLPISPALRQDEHALTLLPASPGTPSCPSCPTSPWGEKGGAGRCFGHQHRDI